MSTRNHAAVAGYMVRKREQIITGVLQDVAELPDRTSPDDAPDMMLVTAEELRAILEAHLSLVPSSK